jgi:hypothetical protein
MSAGSAVCIGFRKVGGIAVPGKDRNACLVSDDGIKMCGGVV